MATIHLLNPLSKSRHDMRRIDHSTTAEIIFFPGVRYERWTEPQKIATSPKKKHRTRIKRDRLDIVVR